MIIFQGLTAPAQTQTQTWRQDLRHDDVAGLVHVSRRLVAQDDFVQRLVVGVGLESKEHRRVQRRFQQIALFSDSLQVEDRLVCIFRNFLGNVLRRHHMLSARVKSPCPQTHFNSDLKLPLPSETHVPQNKTQLVLTLYSPFNSTGAVRFYSPFPQGEFRACRCSTPPPSSGLERCTGAPPSVPLCPSSCKRRREICIL